MLQKIKRDVTEAHRDVTEVSYFDFLFAWQNHTKAIPL